MTDWLYYEKKGSERRLNALDLISRTLFVGKYFKFVILNKFKITYYNKEGKEWVEKKTVPEAKYQIVWKWKTSTEPIYILLTFSMQKANTTWIQNLHSVIHSYGFI